MESLVVGTASDELVSYRLERFGFDPAGALRFKPGPVAKLKVPVVLGTSTFGLVLRLPPDAKPPELPATVDLVQRDAQGAILGGIAVQLVEPK